MKKLQLQVLTNSELETYRLCGEKHGYAYVELLRPKVSALPLSAGNVLHDGIAAGWRAAWERADYSIDQRLDRAVSVGVQTLLAAGQRLLEELAQAEAYGYDPAEAQDLTEKLTKAIDANAWGLEHYFRACRADLEYVPVMIESRFAFRVPTKGGIASMVEQQGKIDLVLWDRESNRLIVQDHKGTQNSVRSLEARLPLDTQLSGYVMALWRLRAPDPKTKQMQLLEVLRQNNGTTPAALAILVAEQEQLKTARIGSVSLNVIRRKRPEQPKINLLTKKQATTPEQVELLRIQTEGGPNQGEVSVAGIDTTAETYAAALEEQAFGRQLPVTEKQRILLAKLRGKGDTYFWQADFFRDSAELERWRREVLIDARKIRESARGDRTRNPGACTRPGTPRCAYASICLNPDDPTVRSGFAVVDSPHQELKEEVPYGESEII